MPLSEEEKLKVLRQWQLDPAKYRIVEEPIQDTAPAPAAPSQMSVMDTVKTRLPRAIAPAMAALPGIMGGTRVGALGGPWGAFVGGILGGLATGTAGSWGQEKVLESVQGPEQYQAGLARQAEAQQAHPIISQLVDAAPNLLAFGPASIPKALGGLRRALVGARLPQAESQALLSTGVNMGVGGGMDVTQQKIMEDKPEIDWTRAAVATGIGGALAEPRGLGRKIFPTPPQLPKAPAIPRRAEGTVEEAYSKPSYTEDDPGATSYQETPDKQKLILKGDQLEADFSSEIESYFSKLPENVQRSVKLYLKEARNDLEYDRTGIENPDARSWRLQALDELPENINRSIFNQKLEILKKLSERKLAAFNQETPAAETPPTQRLSPEQVRQAKQLAQTRGVDLQTPERSIALNPTRDVRGQYEPGGEAEISLTQATRDTPAHEVGHKYLRDLRSSSLKSDRDIVARGLKAAGSEERLAEAIGKRYVDIEDGPLKTWLQDFWSNSKRLVRLGNDEDTIRTLARRVKDDRPWQESPELWNTPEIKEAREVMLSEAGPEIEPRKFEGIPGIEPLIAKIEKVSPKAAQAVADFETFLTRNIGKYVNKSDEITRQFKEPEKVRQYIWDIRHLGQSDVALSADDLSRVGPDGPLRELLVKTHVDQRGKGIEVEGRAAKDDPNYFPMITDQRVLNVITKNPHSAEAIKLKDDFVDHQIKFNKEIAGDKAKAQEVLNDYLRGLGASKIAKGTPEYNAVRRAQGNGLPLSWLEKNPAKIFHRYFNNVSRDFAFYDAVQSKPEIAALFTAENQYGKVAKMPGVEPVTDDNLKVAYKRMTGSHTQQEILFNSIEHMVRGFILGTATGIRNHISTYAQVLPYVPLRDLPKVIEAYGYVRQGLKDSMDLGVNRWHITDIETKNLGFGYYADKLKALGDLARKYQGAEFIERWTRAHNMALGEMVTQAMWGRAAKGDTAARRWFGKFLPEVDPKIKPLNREDILEGAANFVERVQGSYGPKGLPAALIEPSSPLFWIFSLSKWSVEKANTIKQDVISPAIRGEDFGPLLRYALGGVLAGAAITQVNELLSNRKAATPNLEELEAAGTLDDWAYKLFEVSSLAGLGGILSDVAKSTMDVRFGNRPRTPGIPSMNFITEDIFGGLSDVTQAVAEGASPVESLISWARDTVINNIQALKLVQNQYKEEENRRSDKFRDRRVFNQLTDRPVAKQGAVDVNPYDRPEFKEFKRADTMEEAEKVAAEKLRPRLDTESPEKRRRDIGNLRRNSYQTVPSDPIEAREYLDYIRRTQGESAATALLEDKRQQDILNRRKTRLLPPR